MAMPRSGEPGRSVPFEGGRGGRRAQASLGMEAERARPGQGWPVRACAEHVARLGDLLRRSRSRPPGGHHGFGYFGRNQSTPRLLEAAFDSVVVTGRGIQSETLLWVLVFPVPLRFPRPETPVLSNLSPRLVRLTFLLRDRKVSKRPRSGDSVGDIGTARRFATSPANRPQSARICEICGSIPSICGSGCDHNACAARTRRRCRRGASGPSSFM